MKHQVLRNAGGASQHFIVIQNTPFLAMLECVFGFTLSSLRHCACVVCSNVEPPLSGDHPRDKLACIRSISSKNA